MPRTSARHGPPPKQVAQVLRERIYGGVSCLSTLLILLSTSASDSTPATAAIDVAVGGGALWAASLFADYVSHVVAYGHRPRRAEFSQSLWASGQILEAFAVPLVLLVLAGLGLMPFDAAIWAGICVSVVSLGLFALLAARRLPVSIGERVLLVLVVLALGALVVAIKTVAH